VGPPPDRHPRKPRIALPPGSWDCHAHICDARYPYWEGRVYTPPDCLLADYRAMLATLGVERAVLVQPSVYGADNAALLDALAQAGPTFRGVAVVDERIEPRALERMHAAGIRGVRCNIVDVVEDKGKLPLALLERLAARIRPLGWHIELLLHADEFPDLDRAFSDFPVDIVLGHLGYLPTRKGIGDAGFQALLRLLQAGKAWVKLTGPYRISGTALPHADTVPFAHALLDAAPGRIVWGSDWPHVMAKGAMPNDGDLADLLADWIPDVDLRKRVLVDNPAVLYGF
jgi:predicted TIM-barrel fold metal-dependent hydrolase